jgi:membrane protease YdiL (CAAX protease family)
MLIPMGYGASLIVDPLLRKLQVDGFSPVGGMVTMAILVVPLFTATWIMARIEGRRIGDYGLPRRRAFRAQFWQGAAISFVSFTALLLVLRLAGAFSFGSLALHGAAILQYGALWTLPLFLSALLEDFFYRGYLLFTLAGGIGFWPAAVATSLFMAGVHYLNPGGHGLGPFAVLLYCLATCIVIRRTGDLWMALGLHAAAAWSEVFFYGVPSSGNVGQGHLLNASFHGPVWLTGGTFGPEASWPNIALMVIWLVLFSFWLHGIRYPRPGGANYALP